MPDTNEAITPPQAGTLFPNAEGVRISTENYFSSLKDAAWLLITYFGNIPAEKKNEMQAFLTGRLTGAIEALKKIIPDTTASDAAPSKKMLEAIDKLQKRYYNDVAYYLSLALPPHATKNDKALDIDSDLFEAMTFVSWTTREKTETQYQRGEQTITLVETPIYHFTKALAEEYLSLLSNHLSPQLGLKSITHPAWFTALPHWERMALQDKVTKAYEAALNDISQNLGSPSATDVDTATEDAAPRSRRGSTASAEALKFISELQQEPITVAPKTQEAFLEAFAKNMGTASAGSRKLPGLRNFSKHTFTVEKYDLGTKETFNYETFRSSSPSPLKIKNKKERLRVLQLNFEQFQSASEVAPASEAVTSEEARKVDPTLGGNTLLYTGLVSHIGPEASIISTIKTGIQQQNENQPSATCTRSVYANHAINIRLFGPAIQLDKTAKNIIDSSLEKLKQGFQFYQSDKRVNYVHQLVKQVDDWKDNQSQANYQLLHETLTGLIDKVTKDLIELNPSQSQGPVLRRLLFLHSLRDYITLIHQSPSIFSDRNPNLYLAALEQILVGRSLGACKSGKDREALLLIHRDTMIQQFLLNRGLYLPKYDEKDPLKRESFVTRYADNLLSHHEQKNAALNFGGMAGLKNAWGILPRDILTELKRRESEKQKKQSEPIANFLAIQKICSKRNDIKLSLGRRIKAALGRLFQTLGQRLLKAITGFPPKDTQAAQAGNASPPRFTSLPATNAQHVQSTPASQGELPEADIDLTDHRRNTIGELPLDVRAALATGKVPSQAPQDSSSSAPRSQGSNN